MRARIKPSEATPHLFDVEGALSTVQLQKLGDLQLSARGWLHLFCKIGGTAVQKVETRDSIVGRRHHRFFSNRFHIAISVRAHHALTFRIHHVSPEHGATLLARVSRSGTRQL